MTPMEFVLAWEGGYTDDPTDPGGRTNFGISQRAYPDLDIASLTREDAVAIYRRDYWTPAGCDGLPPPMALVAFNASVNCGVARARKWLSMAGGDYREFLRLQIEHYVMLKNATYLRGWINRTLDAWAEARKLESG